MAPRRDAAPLAWAALVALAAVGAGVLAEAQELRPDAINTCVSRCQVGPGSVTLASMEQRELICGCDAGCEERDDCCDDACQLCGIGCTAAPVVAPTEAPTATPGVCDDPDSTYTVEIGVEGVFENGAIPLYTSPEPTYGVCELNHGGDGQQAGPATGTTVQRPVEPATMARPSRQPEGSKVSWGLVPFDWKGVRYEDQSSFCFESRIPLPLELPCTPDCDDPDASAIETFAGVLWHENYVIMPAFLTSVELVLTTYDAQMLLEEAQVAPATNGTDGTDSFAAVAAFEPAVIDTASRKEDEESEAGSEGEGFPELSYRIPLSLLETTNDKDQLPNQGECPGPFPDGTGDKGWCPDMVGLGSHREWLATLRPGGPLYKVDVVFKSARGVDGGDEITEGGKRFWTDEENANAALVYLRYTPVCPEPEEAEPEEAEAQPAPDDSDSAETKKKKNNNKDKEPKLYIASFGTETELVETQLSVGGIIDTIKDALGFGDDGAPGPAPAPEADD